MSAFNFMETFFFFSLGITFVLLGLLIYHFKQRLVKTEEKIDTLFDIIQNLAKELSNVRSNTNYTTQRQRTQQAMAECGPIFTHFQREHDNEHDNMNVQELNLGRGAVINNLGDIIDITNGFDEDDDDDDDEDEDEDDEDDDDDDDEDEDEDDAQPFIKIKIEDDVLQETTTTEVEEVVSEVIDMIDENTSKVVDMTNNEEFKTVPDEDNSDVMEDYKKMSLNALKQLVVSKSLAKDASKLKKNDLLKLLS